MIYYQSPMTTVRFFLNPRTTTFRALPIIPQKVSVARNCFATLAFMNKLVVGNLLHRPLRVAISVLAVAIEVIMILSITGVFIGQVSGSRANTLGVGADMVIQPPNASFLTAIGGAPS